MTEYKENSTCIVLSDNAYAIYSLEDVKYFVLRHYTKHDETPREVYMLGEALPFKEWIEEEKRKEAENQRIMQEHNQRKEYERLKKKFEND
jgi:hypothetical protein